MELAWRHRLTDFVMPFMLQFMRDTTARIAVLEARTKPAEEAHPEHADAAAAAAAAGGFGYQNGMLALTNEAYNPVPVMGGMGGVGMAYGGGGFVGQQQQPQPGFGGGMMPPPTMGGYPGMNGGY